MVLGDRLYTFTDPLRSLRKEEAMTKPLTSSIYTQSSIIGARFTKPKPPIDVFLSFDRHLQERFTMLGKEPPADWLVEFAAWIDSLRKS